MNEKVISPKYTVNTAVVCEILSFKPQQAYNILLALFCINCSTFDVPQVPMCAKKTKFKIKNLKFIMCVSFNKVSPVQLIYH